MQTVPVKEQSPPSHTRLYQLDGLRGLAIVWVIFTHLRLEPFFQAAPPVIQSFLSLLSGNGLVGVAILFMLSGYLMTTLYPVVPSVLEFWQKRYTRIFPAFITMTTALALLRWQWKSVSLWLAVPLVLIFILLAGLLWKKIRQHQNRVSIGKALVVTFLATQLLAAITYIIFQAVVPAAVFFQIWPSWLQSTVTWLVNVTMTLPFGNYVGQLDGVYWSLCLEVMFYLLYPVVFLPVLKTVDASGSKWLRFLAVVSSFIFFYGLSQATHSVLGLYILQLHLGVFFVLGMVLAKLEVSSLGKKLHEGFTKLHPFFLNLLVCVAVAGYPLLGRFLPFSGSTALLAWSLPLSFVFFMTLSKKAIAWTRWLSSKWMVMLGSYSYALYITHTIAIELMVKDGAPQTMLEALFAILGSAVILTILARVIHVFLEQPYFKDKLPSIKRAASSESHASTLTSHKTPLFELGLVASYVFIVWLSHRAPVPLLASVHNHSISDIPRAKLITYTSPIELPFTGAMDGLGMILLNVKPLSPEEAKALGADSQGSDNTTSLYVSVKTGSKMLEQSSYPLYQISDSDFFIVGLPLQSHSQDQNYTVSLSISTPDPISFLALENEDVTFRSVYFYSKAELMKDPKKLLQLLTNKLFQPFSDQKALIQLIFVIPLVVTLLSAKKLSR